MENPDLLLQFTSPEAEGTTTVVSTLNQLQPNRESLSAGATGNASNWEEQSSPYLQSDMSVLNHPEPNQSSEWWDVLASYQTAGASSAGAAGNVTDWMEQMWPSWEALLLPESDEASETDGATSAVATGNARNRFDHLCWEPILPRMFNRVSSATVGATDIGSSVLKYSRFHWKSTLPPESDRASSETAGDASSGATGDAAIEQLRHYLEALLLCKSMGDSFESARPARAGATGDVSSALKHSRFLWKSTLPPAINQLEVNMAEELIQEWTGFQQFPAATQNSLLELLAKLKQENVSSLTILVMGKGGVGKSSTVASVIGERVVVANAFLSEGSTPVMVSRSRAGFTLNIIDTPGLVEGGDVNDQAVDSIKRFVLNKRKTIDILLYVDRLDACRVGDLDRQIIRAITDSFGKGIWKRAAIVLTHAQLSPPDGLCYEEFFAKKSEAILEVVRLGAQMKQDSLALSTPVILVENSSRCNKNESNEKVLPNGVAWIPNLVKTIVDVVLMEARALWLTGS